MRSLSIALMAVLSIALVVHGKKRVELLIAPRELNPLDLKESPYGEIIGAALQEPVHVLSHGGVGHESPIIDSKSREDTGFMEHGADGHTHANPIMEYSKDKPWLARRKIELARLEGKIRQNHNPLGRKASARAYEKKRIAEIMKLAYEMDPTNHGNYTIYVGLEGREGGFERILELSNKTLAATNGRLNDPNDALTAAIAAEMILIYREFYAVRGGKENSKIESDYDFFIKKKLAFSASYDKALAEGRMQQFTQEKVDEMIVIYTRFEYTTKAYRKYIDNKKLES